jgi:ribose/xylose/arabinose/galactoside ABC-type transport system permease subunit
MKCGIDINAGFYRGYLVDDRKLTPHVATLATLVGLWSLIYLVGCVAPAAKPKAEVTAQWSSLAAQRLAP